MQISSATSLFNAVSSSQSSSSSSSSTSTTETEEDEETLLETILEDIEEQKLLEEQAEAKEATEAMYAEKEVTQNKNMLRGTPLADETLSSLL